MASGTSCAFAVFDTRKPYSVKPDVIKTVIGSFVYVFAIRRKTPPISSPSLVH
jgi:hypothetical protein